MHMHMQHAHAHARAHVTCAVYGGDETRLSFQAWRRTKGLGRKKKEGRTPVGCVSAIRDDLDQLEPVLTRAIHPGASVPYVRARRTRLLRAVRTRGAKHGTCAVRVPASGVPYYVPYY